MITVPELAAEALGSLLGTEMRRTFGSAHARLTELVPSVARMALECIGNSDALYHNVEHTMLVTLAGHDILGGRALLARGTPVDWAHVLVACLMHDIGFVRGLLPGDDAHGYVADAGGRKVVLERGASDAALMPHHVDRSKLFVLERIGDIDGLDAPRIAAAIEFTRFPVVTPRPTQRQTKTVRCCEPPTSSVSSAILDTFARSTLCGANLRKRGSINS
jgi:hypothetical protein